ncbi:MAG: S1 family peptidase [Deltaproteobacteria bacterium]|nr:S1 family peptidase [Deltaproteobacteria bacterium]
MLARLAFAPALLACTLTVGCSAETSTDDETGTSGDELRRYDDAAGERPEVGIVRYEGALCTGTLIGPRTVLTAAHCVKFRTRSAKPTEAALGAFSIDYRDGRRRAYEFRRFRSDASVLEVHFDLAVIQLDGPVPADVATPATIASTWPDERLTVYGYGRYGAACKLSDDRPAKRKTTVPSSFPFVKATTCPGDSGGPYFRGTSNEIVATVKGDGLGLEWVGDAVLHRRWILDRRAESERGALDTE